MAGVNKVILLGNLGGDPEVRALPNGVKVANINIANGDFLFDPEHSLLKLFDSLNFKLELLSYADLVDIYFVE